jgi:hypothetical protein
MRKPVLTWILILAPLGSAPLCAQAAPLATPTESAAVVDELISHAEGDSRVEEHLRTLSFDIGGRLTSSHSLMKAEQWCRDQFASWGLDARLEEWGTFPVGFDRGPWSGGMVAPERVDYEFVTRAWSAGTNGPLRARAVLAPTTEEELASVRDRLPGAWLVRKGAPRRRGRGEENADGAAIAEAIAAAGIAGEVLGSRGDLLLTSGRHAISWDDLPGDVRITLRRDFHDDLVARLEEGQAVELEFDVRNEFFEGPVPLHNVVADWRGSEKPDEYVIVCGHLDTWDGAQGTVDNGTGVSTTLEAARLLASVGARPKRTIRFLLWSGEEQGLLGSRAYVEQNREIMEKVSAVLNHDGGTNYLSGLTITKQMEPQLRAALAPLFELSEDFPFELRVAEGLPNFGSSDHASFVKAGVPGFFWNQSGRSNYNHMHHTQYDTFETAVPEYQRHSALVAAIAAFQIADLDQLLDRDNMVLPPPPPPRRMGVQLEDVVVSEVIGNGKAAEAGWQAGDKILAIDGVDVSTRGEVVRALQSGGPRKVFALERAGEKIESVLDYSEDPDEARRAERRSRRDR